MPLVRLILVAFLSFIINGASAATSADEDRFLSIYEPEVFGFLSRIHHVEMTDRERFLVLDARYAKKPNYGYVQCLFHDDDTRLLCEASSGYYHPLQKPSISGRRAIAALGFDMSATESNYQLDLPVSGADDLRRASSLILRALYQGYGVRLGQISMTAPLLFDENYPIAVAAPKNEENAIHAFPYGFHRAITNPQKALDALLQKAENDDQFASYLLHGASAETTEDQANDYTQSLVPSLRAEILIAEADAVEKDCTKPYQRGEVCGIKINPLTCTDVPSEDGYVYRSIPTHDNNVVVVLSRDRNSYKGKSDRYTFIKDEEDEDSDPGVWRLAEIRCHEGERFHALFFHD